MILNYLKIYWRQLIRNKGYSIITIGGLAAGMAVAMLTGLWVYDELSYDRCYENYEDLAQVVVHQPTPDGIATHQSLPMPVSSVLRDEYGVYFKYAAAAQSSHQNIRVNDKVLTSFGCFTENALPEILTLDMVLGTRNALNDNHSILLSASLAAALFGEEDPMSKFVDMDFGTFQVAGVYKDFPGNSSFSRITFLGPVSVLIDNSISYSNWRSSSFHIFVQLNANTELTLASEKIKEVFASHAENPSLTLSLNPMRHWRLYTYTNGVSTAGMIKLVYAITVTGFFVLLLACINFTNLTTARAERRMKEVGIRKSMGSVRMQLLVQFFGETILVVVLATIVCFCLVTLLLPTFNELTNKSLSLPTTEPVFWYINVLYVLLVSFLAGIYPALYLSSFRPARVLKGVVRSGRFTTLPRKVLVVVQFTVSVLLITSTLVIYTQIDHAKNRPVGYERTNLLFIQPPFSWTVMPHYEAFRNELLATAAVVDLARSSSPTTALFSGADNLGWPGKDPDDKTEFGTIAVDPYFDKVVNWEITQGRNFSADRITDSLAFIFNETAIRHMGMTAPIGETVTWHGKTWTIVGVVKDMVMTSPFETVRPTVFMMNNHERIYSVINIKIDPAIDQARALSSIESVFKKYAPDSPFAYSYADQEYASKFGEEERTGTLAAALTIVAILISSLGLVGLASFITELRTKEIGIRKIVGASVLEILRMITSEFVLLVLISCAIAIPVSYFFLEGWLQQYAYHITISWWVFAVTTVSALAITLLAVGYHTIIAAIANPINSLRSE